VALVIQHAKRMRRIILSSVTCLAVPYFSTLLHKLHDFRGGGGKVIEHKMCVSISCTTLSETFLVVRRTQRDIMISVHRFLCEVAVILVRF
jgi:hypothetical protein